MGDTSQVKKDIRDIVRRISKEFNTNFYEGNVLESIESRKYHGVSTDNSISLLVCTNKLQEGKIKAGQRSAIFEKCYLLSLSKSERKILVFSDGHFFNKFIEEHFDYLIGIEAILCK